MPGKSPKPWIGSIGVDIVEIREVAGINNVIFKPGTTYYICSWCRRKSYCDPKDLPEICPRCGWNGPWNRENRRRQIELMHEQGRPIEEVPRELRGWYARLPHRIFIRNKSKTLGAREYGD